MAVVAPWGEPTVAAHHLDTYLIILTSSHFVLPLLAHFLIICYWRTRCTVKWGFHVYGASYLSLGLARS